MLCVVSLVDGKPVLMWYEDGDVPAIIAAIREAQAASYEVWKVYGPVEKVWP